MNDGPQKIIEQGMSYTIPPGHDAYGKMRVTSGSWEGEKVVACDQVLEVSNVEGRLHVARHDARTHALA
jgi:hypothetical protein